jgi:hypothetical protein
MSEAIEVESAQVTSLPKEVTAEIGQVKVKLSSSIAGRGRILTVCSSSTNGPTKMSRFAIFL